MDLDFWNSTYQALWSGTPSNPTDLLLEELDKRLYFLRSFESVPKGRVRDVRGKVLSFLKRPYKGR